MAINNYNEDWQGHSGTEVQEFLKNKLQTHDEKVSGVRVNNQDVEQDANGKVNLTIPTVDAALSDTSANPVQNRAVATAINGLGSNQVRRATGSLSQSETEYNLQFLNNDGDTVFEVPIPVSSGGGEERIYPVVTATRMTSARIKLGGDIRIDWVFDCRSNQQEGSITDYAGTVRAKVQLVNDNGTTTLSERTLTSNTIPGTAEASGTFYVYGADIPSTGTVRVVFTATADIEGELTEVTRTISTSVVSLSLSSDFNPANNLATSGGYTNSNTVTIPYSYSVPPNTTLKVWLDDTLYDTDSISGTSNGRITGIPLNEMSAGKHTVQMLAIDETGLLSDVVIVNFRKAGGTSDYLGLVAAVDSGNVEDVSTDMPLDSMILSVLQFSSLELILAAWNSAATNSMVTVVVDGTTTQTISVDRERQTLTQHFDEAGAHTLTLTMGEETLSFTVNVVSVGTITETVMSGYEKELSAVGRNNSLADRNEWGNVTTFTGLNYSSNGWIDDTLLLTNGAKAVINLLPFADYSSDGNGIHQSGMTVEVELMVSQVTERGATILHCLWDNEQNKAYDTTDATSYPRGIKVATDKASLLFGGVEEIHTAEKVRDENGNYLEFSAVSPTAGSDISASEYYVKVSPNVYQLTTDTIAVSGRTYYEGVVTSKSNAQDLYVVRPFGAEMNIAEDKWMHLAFVIQPVIDTTYLLGMLYINGVLSRVNRFSNDSNVAFNMRQLTPVGITIDSDKADVRVRTIRYYQVALDRDAILSNYIATLHTAIEKQTTHDRNDVSGVDSNNHATISRTTLIDTKKRGVLTIVKSRKKLSDTVNSDLRELFENSVGKKEDFCADYIRWNPPCDANGNMIGEGFEARNVNIRIQGTSSVNYPYKNIRIYLAKTSFHSNATPASVTVGSKTYEYNPTSKKMVYDDGTENGEQFKGYALRGSGNSMVQAVLCAKTDFVDSSLVMNTGGAHLFNDKMKALGLVTPPMDTSNGGDSRVRQAIDGIPCDLYAGISESGPFEYFGQFVLNNEKSKSDKIFGMSGAGSFVPTCPIALEALENRYALTLFQSAGMSSSNITIGSTTTSFGGTPEENSALETLLTNTFGKAFEFNYPEDTFWTQAEINEQDKPEDCHLASDLQKNAIRRLMSFIYCSVKGSNVNISNPEYGDQNGWSATDKAKWYSAYFREHVSEYFDVNYLCTYYLFTEYWASVDQRAKNILWRTWDGLKWFPTYYDGDTAMSIRNDAFMVYLYNVTRDTYDNERSKFAFEGHDSWLWCLLLANVEYGTAQTNPIYNRLSSCARSFRNEISLDAMLTEFNQNMMWNWSERQYNYSQKLKYIDTMDVKYYPYTLTGNREAHRTQFLTERSALLDAQYQVGDYLSDTFTIAADRSINDTPDVLTITSGDLYYYGFRDVQNNWVVLPQRADAGSVVNLTISQALNATSGQSNVTGASKIRELNFTQMVGHINSSGMNLSRCTILEKLIINTRIIDNTAYRFGGTINLGNTTKLTYIDLTGQNGVNTGQANRFDLSRHSRLETVLLAGTGLTTLVLPEGAPITTLALPNTLGTLTLRNMALLTTENVTVENNVWTGFTRFNFANCPGVSWQTLFGRCTNVTRIRIEGISGRVLSSDIAQFMYGWNPSSPNDYSPLRYHGIKIDGTEDNFPQFGGSIVTLIDYVDTVTVGDTTYTFAQMQEFFDKCGLTINQSEFSEYVFHDEEIDPCNITNEDNKTGYAYYDGSSSPGAHTTAASGMTGHPLGYVRSGHIVKLHDKCRPVLGYIDPETHKMKVQELDKDDYTKNIDGTQSDITGSSAILTRDAFLYVPKYYYKGVNNFKEGKKHFFLSSQTTTPNSTATATRRLQLSELDNFSGIPIKSRSSVGELFGDDKLGAISGLSLTTYRVDVEGFRQVRFPGFLDNDNYTCCVFADALGVIVSAFTLTMNNPDTNPADFDNDLGDYDFRAVPLNAKYLYFACKDTAAATSPVVILTDSLEVEAIEPDWVEHKSELVGLYQGWVNGMTGQSGGTATSGIRSIKGKVVVRGTNTTTTNTGWSYDSNGNAINSLPSSKLNGTAQDFFNLASIRNSLQSVTNGEYSLVSYETNKDLANLFMVWFGTRDIENFIGRGGSSNYTTGSFSMSFGDSSYLAANQSNKIWGIECWTASMFEWMDKGCMNTPSYAAFKKNKRLAPTGSVIDYYYNILQQNGEERRVKAYPRNNQSGVNVARVRFGRYCDIVVSSFAGDDTTYLTCYAAAQTAYGVTGRVLGRSSHIANASAGVAYAGANYASSYSHSYHGGRLCFFGEIENESDLE